MSRKLASRGWRLGGGLLAAGVAFGSCYGVRQATPERLVIPTVAAMNPNETLAAAVEVREAGLQIARILGCMATSRRLDAASHDGHDFGNTSNYAEDSYGPGIGVEASANSPDHSFNIWAANVHTLFTADFRSVSAEATVAADSHMWQTHGLNAPAIRTAVADIISPTVISFQRGSAGSVTLWNRPEGIYYETPQTQSHPATFAEVTNTAQAAIAAAQDLARQAGTANCAAA